MPCSALHKGICIALKTNNIQKSINHRIVNLLYFIN